MPSVQKLLVENVASGAVEFVQPETDLSLHPDLLLLLLLSYLKSAEEPCCGPCWTGVSTRALGCLVTINGDYFFI